MAFKSNLLFDVLANILKNKSYDEYMIHINSDDWKTVSKFMILRYLTMHNNSNIRLYILDNFLSFERMETKILYKVLINSIPKQKSTFIRYIR